MKLNREQIHKAMECVNSSYSKKTLVKGQIGLAVYDANSLAVCEPLEHSVIDQLSTEIQALVNQCPEGMMAVVIAEKTDLPIDRVGKAVGSCNPSYVGFVGLKGYTHEEGVELLQQAHNKLSAAGQPGIGGLCRGNQTFRLEPADDNPGRNEKCRCGSGLKYKKCCGRFDNN